MSATAAAKKGFDAPADAPSLRVYARDSFLPPSYPPTHFLASRTAEEAFWH